MESRAELFMGEKEEPRVPSLLPWFWLHAGFTSESHYCES